MNFDPIQDRLQRELEVVVSLQDIARKKAEHCTRMNLKEVSAFESGIEAGYEYMRGVLIQLMVDISEWSEVSQNGEEA